MAESGETTTSFENPGYEPSHWDDGDDYGDKTTPFLPPQSSTPASNEEIEMQTMQTMQHEKNGLAATSYAETSFGAPTLSEQAWVAAKDLFPNMSSSELEVSYNAKGRLQVKIFGAGKKLYYLTTTEKETGREQINKSLLKEIKTALGQSKYEKVQQTIYEKRKEIKEKEWEASEKEQKKREMDEIRQKIRKEQQNLESLENSEASQRKLTNQKQK